MKVRRKKVLGVTLLLFATFFLLAGSLSLLARKQYASGLRWRSAWLACVGFEGWRFALGDAILPGDTIADLERKLGPAHGRTDAGDGLRLYYYYDTESRPIKTSEANALAAEIPGTPLHVLSHRAIVFKGSASSSGQASEWDKTE